MVLRVEVLDLGINNLRSLCRGFVEAGPIQLSVITSAEEAADADLVVLPGVGAYGAAIDELRQRGLDRIVAEHTASGGFLFGVCLGMQLLGTSSDESPGVAGLGIVPGKVVKLAANSGSRVPHMGWEGVQPAGPAEVLPALREGVDFYFVHSYALQPDDDRDVLVTSLFGQHRFVSGVLRERTLGLQFHPEKSSRAGIDVLRDVVAWAHG